MTHSATLALHILLLQTLIHVFGKEMRLAESDIPNGQAYSRQFHYTVKDSSFPDVSAFLQNHPVFNEYWDNTETFPYENVRITDLPEQINITLLRDGECFTPTWYGRLNSSYKKRWGRQHHGLDIYLHTGDKVYAAFDGIVRYAQYNRNGYGNCIVIRHFNGLETVYAHLSRIQVPVNSMVRSGDLIGKGGNTGRSYGSHLHFEVRYKDFSIDPEQLIDLQLLDLRSDTLRIARNSLVTKRYPDDPQGHVDMADSLNIVAPWEWSVFQAGSPEERNTSLSEPEKTVLPAKKTVPVYYTIRKGDHLGIIQKKTGVPLSKIKSLNPQLNPKRLMPGKKLRIR